MKPSRLTRLQCDIFLLALEFRLLDCRAMHHQEHAGVQRSRCNGGADPRLNWAISFLAAIPKGGERLVHTAHSHRELSYPEARRAARYLRMFYNKIERAGLDKEGEFWLNVMGN